MVLVNHHRDEVCHTRKAAKRILHFNFNWIFPIIFCIIHLHHAEAQGFGYQYPVQNGKTHVLFCFWLK